MSSADIIMKPVGVIRTPFREVSDNIPIQGQLHPGAEGHVELFEEFRDACRDLEGFSHVFLLYHFHFSSEQRITTKPYMDISQRGVFSTRSPHRPNHIGMSLVRLTGIDRGILSVLDVDMVDGSPLLDIKPFNPVFDAVPGGIEVKTGWMTKALAGNMAQGITKTASHDDWLRK